MREYKIGAGELLLMYTNNVVLIDNLIWMSGPAVLSNRPFEQFITRKLTTILQGMESAGATTTPMR